MRYPQPYLLAYAAKRIQPGQARPGLGEHFDSNWLSIVTDSAGIYRGKAALPQYAPKVDGVIYAFRFELQLAPCVPADDASRRSNRRPGGKRRRLGWKRS